MGQLECVGSNAMGQSDVPHLLDNVLTASAGGAFTCAVQVNRLRCWGDNKYGQLNVPTVLTENKLFINK